MRKILFLILLALGLFPAAGLAILSSPVLSYTSSGLNISTSWTTVPGATGYYLLYAPCPYLGEETIVRADMGGQTSLSVDLWEGAAYYILVGAYNQDGEGPYSNIGQFSLTTENQEGWPYYAGGWQSNDQLVSDAENGRIYLDIDIQNDGSFSGTYKPYQYSYTFYLETALGTFPQLVHLPFGSPMNINGTIDFDLRTGTANFEGLGQSTFVLGSLGLDKANLEFSAGCPYRSSAISLVSQANPDAEPPTAPGLKVDTFAPSGSEAEVAVGVDGTVHMAYLDKTDGSFKYAWKTDDQWTIQTLDATDATSNSSYRSISLAVDDQGKPHILYVVEHGWSRKEVRYASYDGQWQKETIENIGSSSVEGTKLLMTDDGEIHLLYDVGHLYHARKSGNGWVISHFQYNPHLYPWDAVAVGNGLLLSFHRKNDFSNDKLWVHSYANGSWTETPVDTDPLLDQPAIAVDSHGDILLVGGAASSGLALLRVSQNMQMTEQILDDSGEYLGYYNDMALDADDRLHILASDWDWFDKKVLALYYYSYSADGVFTQQLIAEGEYQALSLVVDAAGNVHMVYYDEVRKELRYATLAGN